jgi:DNA-binding NarL/FixJ family response regulator
MWLASRGRAPLARLILWRWGIPLNPVLLIQHDPRELYFVETTLDRAGTTDIVLLHEQTLSRALRLLQVCEVQLILIDSGLPEGSLEESVRALRLQAPRTPIVVLWDERSKPRQLSGVHATIRHHDTQGLLATLDVLLK